MTVRKLSEVILQEEIKLKTFHETTMSVVQYLMTSVKMSHVIPSATQPMHNLPSRERNLGKLKRIVKMSGVSVRRVRGRSLPPCSSASHHEEVISLFIKEINFLSGK
ncbi:hypothetical protein J6590_038369 [Homalodisca vitripennis]|nr:hypothetical protein J6590_038369 [Homalodisca vitripennis]